MTHLVADIAHTAVHEQICRKRGIAMTGRLNGWQRIGVVLTTLWLLFVAGAGVVGYSRLETGRGPFVLTISGDELVVAKGTNNRCTKKATDEDLRGDPETHEIAFEVAVANCSPGHLLYGKPDVKLQLPAQHRLRIDDMVLAAFLPPVVAWILIYGAVVITRWIAIGFRQRPR